MAFLFAKPKSPFWWVNYRDPDTGRRQRISTGLRRDRYGDTRKARQRESELTLQERSTPAPGAGPGWDSWVPAYLQVRYQGSSQSLLRYTTIWRNIRAFLRERCLRGAGEFRREHAFEFFTWRQRPQPGLHKAAHNTALLELKILGMLCKEAIRRGHLDANPVAELGLKKSPPKRKPALSPDQLALVEDAIAADHSEHRLTIERCWLIARWQGCRISETWLNPQTDVTLWQEPDGTVRGRVRLRGKGGKRLEPPLAPPLIPLFQKLQAEGATETYPRLMNGVQPRTSRIFHDFLNRHGLKRVVPGLTHHCLRVTAATNMARAGIRKDKAMELLGHDNEAVHQAYVRFRQQDFDDAFAAMGAPPAASPSR
jgi:integrase